jgi:hypothetical protein
VGTTGEVRIEVGRPEPATELPLYAAMVRGAQATIFVVDDGVARSQTLAVRGEVGGALFVDPALAPDSLVVTEGRALLVSGDRVSAQEVPEVRVAAAPQPLVERARP